MINIALIGSGYVGKLHGSAIQKSRGLKLAAVVDTAEEQGKAAAVEFGCPFYPRAEELFEKEKIDAIDICLPTFLHEQYVLLGAKHKKHILCEKPFALSSDSALRMKEAAEKAGVCFMIAQVVRYMPEYMEIRKLMEKVGDIHMVKAARLAQHPNWTSWHRDPLKSGGGLFDLHLHDIDYLYSLFGELDSVDAVGWKSPSGCWNHITSTLRFKNGVKAAVEGCMEITGDYPFTAHFMAVGGKASLEYRLSAGFNIENLAEAGSSLMLFEKDKAPQKITVPPGDGFQNELEAFAQALEKGGPVPILPDDSLYVMRVIEALRNSLETGTITKLT